MNISQHPNPQFEREAFVLLNGEWKFDYTKAVRSGKTLSKDSGEAVAAREALKNGYRYTINVPFCIQSCLSGIGETGFIATAVYKKTVNIAKNGRRVFLNIGAADYLTTVLVNGKPCARHRGGYTPIRAEITDFVTDGDNEIFIYCEDNEKSPYICRGKQSEKLKSHGCDYTRTTGIWQSVYLEYTPASYIKNFRIYPDINDGSVTVISELSGSGRLEIEAFYDGKKVGSSATGNASGYCILKLMLDDVQLWEAGNGRLYDLKLSFGKDEVKSYFGMRSVELKGMKFLINGKSVFQRLVLDQGFYKKGIYTAENDEELLNDIKISKALGFNGARLHQKVFDPRFLYFCDREGYLVWGEYPNWGLDYSNPRSVDIFLSEWKEALERDFNHPSIIGWCPFNETWDYKGRKQYDPLLATVYDFTKSLDITRPCIDTSGNFHVKTDIFDLHDYRYKTDEFKKSYDRFISGGELYQHVLNDNPGRQVYGGQPVFMSEYGGIKWETDKQHKAWGYGNDVTTGEEFFERYRGLTEALLGNEKFFGFCYTQLYDIEQEQNGLYSYERKEKFPKDIYERIKAVNTGKAAIE
ncbi:MAG: beta-galactosidase [Eubacterium sp.]|nr:beta-galactosidase [Eubacterium sp.]